MIFFLTFPWVPAFADTTTGGRSET